MRKRRKNFKASLGLPKAHPKALALADAFRKQAKKNPKRHKNVKWKAGWYWLEFVEGKPERQKVWLGPRQAASVAKSMRYQARHIREMTHDYEDKHPRTARSFGGALWQRELGVNRRRKKRRNSSSRQIAYRKLVKQFGVKGAARRWKKRKK